MKNKQRLFDRLALGCVSALALAIAAGPVSAETLRVVMQAGLRVTDPVMTTAFITRDHGYMIFDTLLGMDSKFQPQPQMADWKVSDDGKDYVFTLRDGLKWHDGTPVTAEDCVASIKRWAEVDGTGMPLFEMVESITPVDEKSFEIKLKQPTTLLLEGLAKISSRPAFMMPKRLAETPAAENIPEMIGSGPFRFVAEEFQPGLKVVYEKNPDYVSRDEPSDWTAGGKKVNVDRVEWIAMPDQMTAMNALLNNEIDLIQQVPFDLLPLAQSSPDLKVESLDPLGNWTYFRMNHLYPPFDNKLVRQAAMAAVNQVDVLSVLVGDPAYYQTCVAVMGCGNPNGTEEGAEWVGKGDIELAKKKLAEAGYDGTEVVILQPTDLALTAPQPVVIGDALRKAGFNVNLKTMDWQTVVMNQGNQNPPSEGGWNLFSTFAILATSGDPFSNTTLSAQGRKSWAGWPDVPRLEELRMDYAKAGSRDEQKAIAAEIQKVAIDEGVVGPLGQFKIMAAWNQNWDGFLQAPVTLFWNVDSPNATE